MFTRNPIQSCKAQALYFRKAKTKEDLIELMLSEPKFFQNVKKKWDKLNEKKIDNPRIFYTSIDEWNCYTLQIYTKLLDFLEFPEETEEWKGNKCYIRERPSLVPVKRCKEELTDCNLPCEYRRDFEAYSDSHEERDHIPCGNIGWIREGVLDG